MKSTLPSIVKIEYAKATTLHIDYPGKIVEGITLNGVTGDFFELPIENNASITIQSEKQNGQDVFTTTSAAKMSETVGETSKLLAMLAANNMCYRLTDVYGKQYLIGTTQKPFPDLTYKYDNPEAPAGSRIYAVEIKQINLFSALLIK